MMRRGRAEHRLRTQRAAGFDGNVPQPFDNSQSRLLHGPNVAKIDGLLPDSDSHLRADEESA
jgi:hypothetical protein